MRIAPRFIKASIVVLAFLVALWWTEQWAVVFLGLSALAVAVIIHQNNWQIPAFRALAAFLPWSVKVDLGAVSMMLPSEWGIGTLALVVLLSIITNNTRPKGWGNWLPILWILTFILPVLLSSMLKVSIKFALINAVYLVTFFYGTLTFGSSEANRWIRNYFVSFVGVALWGWFQFYLYEFNPITIVGIFKPFYYSSTYVGAVAAMYVGYFIGRIPNSRKQLLFALTALGIVLFSESRAALLSLVVMLAGYGLLRLPKSARIITPILILVVGGAAIGPEKIREAFAYNTVESHDPNANVFEETLSVTNVQTDVSNIERLNRWVSALKMFQDRPHFGFGPGTYQFQYIPYQEAGLKNRLSVRNPDDVPQGSGGSAHSELLLQLSENGWPSVLLFILMLGLWMYRSLIAPGGVGLAPFFLGLITYLFHMNVNNFLNQPGFAFLFWTFGAMLMTNNHE